mmetsp:Transcript_11778/g.23997  ORF Transcript_11778/g.23997 Transcript_11778/m.23997 type:complete len:193 (-) Transcript_11778:117-695(-)
MDTAPVPENGDSATVNVRDVMIIITVAVAIASFWKIVQVFHRWNRRTMRHRRASATSGERIGPLQPEQVAREPGKLDSSEINDILEKLSSTDGKEYGVSKAPMETDGQEWCVICLDEFGQSKTFHREVVELPNCHHVFHTTCMKTFLRRGISNQCPLCRDDLVVAFLACSHDLIVLEAGRVTPTSERSQSSV